jgi:hypothetical protein
MSRRGANKKNIPQNKSELCKIEDFVGLAELIPLEFGETIVRSMFLEFEVY